MREGEERGVHGSLKYDGSPGGVRGPFQWKWIRSMGETHSLQDETGGGGRVSRGGDSA